MPVQTKDIAKQEHKLHVNQSLTDDSRKHLKNVALRTYSDQRNSTPTEEQITSLIPMVRKVAQRAATYLKPPLSFEDLVSAGIVGLIKAARDFDSSYLAAFKTYAFIRIKGAILDELRRLSLLPSNLNKQVMGALELSRKITQQTGTPPTDEELAQELGITIKQVGKLFEKARAHHFISLDGGVSEQATLSDFIPASDASTPHCQLEKTELIEQLSEAIKLLDTKRRQIILLYYQQQLSMKQIGEVLNITESRVSQLHASAVFNLSVKLRKWKDGR